jgi:bacterioferritin-associated ferredoxin
MVCTEGQAPVYVCLCRAVSNTTIEAAIRAGASTVESVSERCGAATQCGKCRHTIEVLLAGLATPPGNTPAQTEPRSSR